MSSARHRTRPSSARRLARGWLPSLGLLLPVVACTASTGDTGGAAESVATQHAALDPSNDTPPTSYQLTMWVTVNDAREPTAAAPEPSPPPAPAGTCWQSNTDGDCSSDNVCGDYRCWTTDTGYQFWGQLAARVDGTPYASSCVFDTPANLGVYTWDTYYDGPPTNPNVATLTTCAGSGQQNGGANGPFMGGQPLTLNITVNNPTDVVQLASVLDNVESTPAPNVPGSTVQTPLQQLQSDVSTGLSGMGSAAKILYAGADAAAMAATMGTINSVIGEAASISNLLWPSPTPNNTPGVHESCVGGVFANGSRTAGDTLLMQVTGAQLDTAAKNGIELQFDSSGSWAQTSDGTAHCETNLVVHIDVSRTWANGLAAAPRSGDFAIVSAPGEEQVFVVPQDAPAGADTANQFLAYSGSGSSWSMLTTDGYPTYGSGWSEGVVNTGTSGAIVQLAEYPANGQDEVFAWADTTGSIRVQPFNHAVTGFDFAYSKVAFTGTYTPEVCISGPIVRSCIPQAAQNLVPANAHVTGVARGAELVDLFFVDAQGNLRNLESGDGGVTWQSYVVDSSGDGVGGSPVTAVARTHEAMDVFYLGKSGLQHAQWNGAQWSSAPVAGTQSLVSPGGWVTAVAQSVNDVDAFWIDPNGALERGTEVLPTQQPTLVVGAVSGGATGNPGGPIAAVSREPGVVDVVFQAPTTAASAAPIWYSLAPNSTWSHGVLPGGDASEGIAIVAPSSYELRVFMKTFLSDVYTTDYVATGAPAWSALAGVETLGYLTLPTHPIPIAVK